MRSIVGDRNELVVLDECIGRLGCRRIGAACRYKSNGEKGDNAQHALG